MNRRGSVAIMVALAAVPLLLMAGLALDATRLWLVRIRLQGAVDAAALLAAYEIGAGSQVADAQALFWVNFSRGAPASGTGFLGATSTGATVTQVDSTHAQVAAQASVALTLMRLAGLGPSSVSAATAIAAKGTGYEIALALDTTGSMLNCADGSSTAGCTTKEQALQTAASDMLDIVYGTADAVPDLSVSVVPFRGSVNMGSGRRSWLAAGAYQAANWSAQAWRGCVLARTGGYDLTEDSPATAPFSPLYWATTFQAKSYQSCLLGNLFCTTKYYPGDNDWTAGTVTDTGNGAAATSAWSGLPVGPNLGCSNGVVLPLTASKVAVKSEVSGLVAASGGSTVLSQGLQWAWFTLSPLWQGSWGLAAASNGAARPLSYAAYGSTKVVVMMTDGNDEWDGNELTAQNLDCGKYAVWPECVQTDGYLNAYGRLSADRIGIAMPSGSPPGSSSAASTAAAPGLDKLTTKVCTAMKQQGIVIYTIAFQAAAGSDAETLLQSCATDAAHYFNTETGSDIDAAFTSIGRQLVSLRLTQ